MIRIRFFGLFLSIPAIVCLLGLVYFIIDPLKIVKFDVPLGWAIMLFGVGVLVLFRSVFACPSCGKSPYAFGKGGLAFFGSPFPQRKCSSCGFDMATPQAPAESARGIE